MTAKKNTTKNIVAAATSTVAKKPPVKKPNPGKKPAEPVIDTVGEAVPPPKDTGKLPAETSNITMSVADFQAAIAEAASAAAKKALEGIVAAAPAATPPALTVAKKGKKGKKDDGRPKSKTAGIKAREAQKVLEAAGKESSVTVQAYKCVYNEILAAEGLPKRFPKDGGWNDIPADIQAILNAAA